MQRTLLSVTSALLVLRISTAFAGSLDHAKVALHVHAPTLKGLCVPITQGGVAPVGPCSGLVTAARTESPVFLYVIAAQADSGQGFSAISTGIDYSSGLLAFLPDALWYGCATTTSFDGPYGPWPTPGSGARLEWSTCQIAPPAGFENEGAFTVVGAIEITAVEEGWASIAANPGDSSGPALKVFDCAGTETILPSSSAGKVRFTIAGTEPGYNPCSPATTPICLTVPKAVDFGTVYIPGTKDTTITLWNTGNQTIQGVVGIQNVPYYLRYTDFYLRTGVTGFRLDPGAHLDLQIEYVPSARESHAMLTFGSECLGIELQGSGVKGIEIVPDIIDFGIVPADSAVVDSFQVINTSPVRLTFERLTTYEGERLDCPYFLVPGNVFDLEPGASVKRLVRFKSAAAGVHECGVSFGSIEIQLNLKAEIVKACGIEPAEIDFGAVWTDQTVDTTFTFFNSGSSKLLGEFTGVSAGFQLPTAGTYTLSPGESTLVDLRFHSSQAGPKQAILRFQDCASLTCRANVLNASRTEPGALNFGWIPAGATASLPFQVYNESDHPLQGNVQLHPFAEGGDLDPRFSVAQGQGPFVLPPGDVLVGQVVFHSTTSTPASGLLTTGVPNGTISLTANQGQDLPLSHARLPLHLAPHGSGTLCPPYSRGGLDPRSIPCSEFVTRGQDHTGYDVYLMAANLDRPAVLGVDFGLAYDADAHHGIDVFGWTSCSDLQYASDTWPNSGAGNLLTWDYTVACPNDSLNAVGDHRAVLGVLYVYAYSADVLRVTPRSFAMDPGPHFMDCSLTVSYIGAPGCGSAVFTSGGSLAGCNPCLAPCPDQGLWCSVFPSAIDFGSVMVGASLDTIVHVINTSPHELKGYPSFGSSAFSLPEVTGQIMLAPGAVHDLRVRFHPDLPGMQSSHFELGASCPLVTLTGTGQQPLPEIILRTRASWIHDSHTARIQVSGTVWEKTGKADIRIYDVQGRLMHEAHMQSEASTGTYLWTGRIPNGHRAPGGMYYVQVKAAGASASTSFLLLP